jgi:hypothetical protein
MAVSQESRYAVAELRRITGKHYPKLEAAFEAMDVEAQRELVRLCHDLQGEIRSAERKGATQPWRYGR